MRAPEESAMRIVVLDGYTLNPGDNPWTAVASLGELVVYDRTPPARIVERAVDAEIILTNKTPLSAATLEQLPRLRFISVLATGFNIVDIAAARARAIPVSNVPEYGTDSVAQHVLAVLLHFCHQSALHDRLIRAGEWQRHGDFCFWETRLSELVGKRIGIIGFGRIGRRVGDLAHALGMEVLAYDVRPGNEPGYQPFSWQSIDVIFRESDVVTLHCPQTNDNVGLVNRALLSRMKPTALLINASRGGLVHEQDLADALNQGVLAGAALDVLSSEPPPATHPLLHAKNCLITPHVAWATLEARRRMTAITAENVAAFLRGRPQNVVNDPDSALQAR
jgi:glycerate dehydrogenase